MDSNYNPETKTNHVTRGHLQHGTAFLNEKHQVQAVQQVGQGVKPDYNWINEFNRIITGLTSLTGPLNWSNLVVVLVVDAAGAEHEPVHAHAQVLPVGFEAFPHEHAGALLVGHLAVLRRNGVRIWNNKSYLTSNVHGGRHSIEVAFSLLTQPSQVRFLCQLVKNKSVHSLNSLIALKHLSHTEGLSSLGKLR